MDFDSMAKLNSDSGEYSNYDNRPIRPMDQEALNEALARLPILVDDDDLTSNSDSIASLRIRRQPALAYSTRRKLNNSVNHNQTSLNFTLSNETPLSNKRRVPNGTTPTSFSLPSSTRKKSVKRLGFQQELVNLKEEKQNHDEEKNNSQLELIHLKKLHHSELELIKEEHRQAIEKLVSEHQIECESLKRIVQDQKLIIDQMKMELGNLRDDYAIIILEKETLTKMVDEYQLLQQKEKYKIDENELIIKKLKEEISQIKENQQPKREINRVNANNNRTVLKETTVLVDRLKVVNGNSPTNNKDLNRSKFNTKTGFVRGTSNKDDLLKTPTLTINSTLIKSNPMTLKSNSTKPKLKLTLNNETETKSIGFIDKPKSIFSARAKTPLVSIK